MTEADLKVASDFIHEWINEEAKLHGSSHMRVVRDALAALIHDQRVTAIQEGLTLSAPHLPNPNDYLVETAFARGQRDGYILCQNALQRLMSRKLQVGADIEAIEEAVDCLAGVQPTGKVVKS